MSLFQWKITIHPKPRGLWRPRIEIAFWARGENELNINPSYYLPEVRDANWNRDRLLEKCSDCGEANRTSLQAPFAAYSSSSARDLTPKHKKCCHLNSFLLLYDRNIENIFQGFTFSFYPEWRPGKADYADIIDWLAEHICKPVIEEFEKRLQEASESEPLDKLIVTSENYEFTKAKKEVEDAQRPIRKLKVL